MDIRGITVSVGYDDMLAITLKRNMRFMTECVVVTHPRDEKTKSVALSVSGVRVFETNAFYENNAKFNKGLALEQGFDFLGREGWILGWDADILFPEAMNFSEPKIGNLYSPPRYILADPKQFRWDMDWSRLPQRHDVEFAGYFQLFHADDSVLKSRPWHGTDYTHCGGGDFVFQNKWLSPNKIRPKFHVLHLGPPDANWFGRASERIDGQAPHQAAENKQVMEEFLSSKGWGRSKSGKPFEERIKQ